MNVPEEQTFWLLGGTPIRNIDDLAKALKKMSQETFAFHVNDERNDFATWVETATKDKALATLIRTTKEKQRMAAIVQRRAEELTQPETKEPTIVRTKNITKLALKNISKEHIVHTPHKTQLGLYHQPPKAEIYLHETNKSHHSSALIISHLVLGIVVGVALAALVLAFQNI